MSCLLDGRGCAASYFKKHAKEHTEYQEQMVQIAGYFDSVFRIAKEMEQILCGYDHSLEGLKCFINKENRQKICQLILKAKAEDEKALNMLKQIR